MPAIKVFDQGLNPQAPRDGVPEGNLRVGTGLAKITRGSAKSRNGCTQLRDATTAHSLFYFNDKRYYAVGDTLYHTNGSVSKAGLSGARLTFAVAPPTLGQPDYLFCTDGTNMFKVAGSGNTTNWGIAPFADAGLALAAGTGRYVQIEAFDAVSATWTAVGGTCALNTTNYTENTKSVKLTGNVPSGGLGPVASIYRPHTIDLTTFGGGVASPDEDDISVQIYIDNPDQIEYVVVGFALNTTYSATAEANDEYLYVARFNSAQAIKKKNRPMHQGVGINMSQQQQRNAVATNASPHVTLSAPNARVDATTRIDTFDTNRKTVIENSSIIVPPEPNTWWELRIPKDAFQKAGTGAYTWANVVGIKIGYKVANNATAAPNVSFDNLQLKGGYGLRGTYRGYVVAVNTFSGTESNPQPTYLEVEDIDRQPLTWTLPGTHADSQVNYVRLYRTLGDGGLYFRDQSAVIATTSVTDAVADYPGMITGSGVSYLQMDELHFDNVKPEGTYADVCGPYLGRLWMTRDSAAGRGDRLYYTRAGYVEGVQGFVSIGNTDEQCQKSVIWNRALYVFSKRGVYQILGTNEPFIPLQVRNVPGTTKPFSVQATPFGIIYEADDGIRVFNGTTSTVDVSAPIAGLFQGETLDGLATWAGTLCSTAGEDYYYVSDGTTTLCLNSKGQWRDIGIGCNALNYEPTTGLFIACITVSALGEITDQIVTLEAEDAASDCGQAITVSWELPHMRLSDNQNIGTLRRISIDINPNGQSITPTLIEDGTEIALPPLTGTTRQAFEYPRNDTVRVLGLRLDAQVTAQIELFGIEPDVYIGQNGR